MARPRVARLITARLRLLVDGLLSVAWASCCAACGTPLASPTQGPVCRPCWQRIPRIVPPVCLRCGVSLPRPGHQLCGPCLGDSTRVPLISRQRAVGWYEGTLRSIIHAYKYQHRRSLAQPLAALMREAGRPLLGDVHLVVPVPLHPRRRWERGFNQAADLAALLGPPVAHLLRRTRATPPQTDLPASRRRRNVCQAFALANRSGSRQRSLIHDKAVALADDVATTGATLDECAKVLRAAGAREVYALTIARVPTRPPSPHQRPPRPLADRHR